MIPFVLKKYYVMLEDLRNADNSDYDSKHL